MPAKHGNTNALKHGLYAKSFTPQEKKDLAKMPLDNLSQEIALLRAVIARAWKVLEASTPGSEADSEAYATYARTLASFTVAITQLGQLTRTHAILTGSYTPIDDALAEALAGFDPYYSQDDNNSDLSTKL